MLHHPPNPDRLLDFNYMLKRPITPVFHSHAEYEIYFFHEGICNYLIGDQIHSLAPGDLILMYGMTLHCAKIDPSVPYVRSIIHFDPYFVHPHTQISPTVNILQPFQQLKNARLRLNKEQRLEVETILERMNRFAEEPKPLSNIRQMHAFMDLLCLVYDNCTEKLQETAETTGHKEVLVQQMICWLELHYTEDLHMGELERQMHFSKSYLAKLFKEVTGVTIFEYLYRKRINEARIRFMMDTSARVTDVCYELGFKHIAHFSRMFKEQVGHSPEKYRRNLEFR
jgi:AraC-like DNA-binding protein